MRLSLFLLILCLFISSAQAFFFNMGFGTWYNPFPLYFSPPKPVVTKKVKQQSSKSQTKIQSQLPKFVQKYGKSYNSYNELVFRDTVFTKNMKLIEQNNNKQNASFRMGVTRFADLTSDEFNQLILMQKEQKQLAKFQEALAKSKTNNQNIYNQPLTKTSTTKQQNKIQPLPKVNSTVAKLTLQLSTIINSNKTTAALPSLPVIVNWVTKGKVGVIKQQGICGSCYAFSALSAIQSMYLINNMTTMGKSGQYLGTTKKLTFSQQHIVDCCDIPKKCDMGCAGGYVWSTFEFINRQGLYLQQNYPYRASDQNYVRKCDGARGLFHNFLNPTVPYFNVSKGNTTQLRQILGKGPVSVLIDATNMPFYVADPSGVPQPFSNCSDKVHNHAVLLVGVDKAGNWLIKNSWGTQWGDKGYITLAAGNTCGIANYATYPNPYFGSNTNK